MSISEIVFRWFARIGISLLAAYGMTQLFITPDSMFNCVRFAVFAVGIGVIELILAF